MSLVVKHMKGIDGQIDLVGFHAVVAMFLRWSIERREESHSDDASWILHAVLSYANKSLINKPVKKRIRIRLTNNPDGTEKWYEAVPEDGVEWKIEDDRLMIVGVTLCQADPPRRSRS